MLKPGLFEKILENISSGNHEQVGDAKVDKVYEGLTAVITEVSDTEDTKQVKEYAHLKTQYRTILVRFKDTDGSLLDTVHRKAIFEPLDGDESQTALAKKILWEKASNCFTQSSENNGVISTGNTLKGAFVIDVRTNRPFKTRYKDADGKFQWAKSKGGVKQSHVMQGILVLPFEDYQEVARGVISNLDATGAWVEQGETV